MGYGRSGRLRPPATALLPRLPCHPNLFRCRLTRLARQRPGEGTCVPLGRGAAAAARLALRYANATCLLQWISEVMHFCAGLPIILVGCKKDLRRDPRVIEELRKTNQRPVTPEEVRRLFISRDACVAAPVADHRPGYGRGPEDRRQALSRMFREDG